MGQGTVDQVRTDYHDTAHGTEGSLSGQVESGEMTQAGVEVEKAGSPASSTENSRRVCCISCGHTLLEISVETPEGSRVWMRVRCKGCKAFNVAVLKDGKLTVSATS